ncbi:MAG: hypothetical protein IJ203_02535 [Atopobiaceae bacterium]|nr:hypothetical protein [Atopobiaceae bacterium]
MIIIERRTYYKIHYGHALASIDKAGIDVKDLANGEQMKRFDCDAVRLPDTVLLTYYTVEQVNDHPALG